MKIILYIFVIFTEFYLPMNGQSTFNLARLLPYPEADFRHVILYHDTIAGIGIGFNNNIEWKQGVVIAKLDSFGNVLNANIILDSLGDAMAVGKAWGEIIKTADGGYAVTAATVERTSAFLIKLDNNLQVEFIKEYPDTVNLSNYAYTLLETPKGYLLFGGIQRPDYYDDGFIHLVDKQGNTTWFKYVAYSNYTNAVLDIKRVNDSVYVAGVATQASINPHTGFASLLYFDLDGNELNYWASELEPKEGYIRKVIPAIDGGIILFGVYVADIVNGIKLFQPTVSKLNPNFQTEWVSHFGNIRTINSYITLWDFALTSDGNYVGAGETTVKDGGDPTRRVGWLYKFSPTGDSIWERKVNAPFLPLYYTNSGFFTGVGILSSGSIVAGGTANEGNTDYCWLVKVTADGCLDTLFCQPISTVVYPDQAFAGVEIFPNPASSRFNIQSPEEIRHVALFDAYGKMILEQQGAGKFLTIDLPSLMPMGLYVVEIQTEDHVSVRKKIYINK
ncbi:MAG: T9SS type A sorting domain-containing protein [Thermoanaerobaculia bacterium]|nr:T9SS type A sorting domain-containing protein [Thermoanaerobaculia bacterium]